MPSSWLLPEVAAAQLEVAKTALQKPLLVRPYLHFVQALELIQPEPGTTLLDAGCGTSGYGLLCAKYFPEVAYTGTDASTYMIRHAKKLFPKGTFEVKPLEKNDFGNYDIVLVSAVLEYAGRWSALENVLEEFKHYLILHRMRGTNEPSRSFSEPTYCGNREDFYLWNRADLRACIGKFAKLEHEIIWEDGLQMTLVVSK